MWVRVWTLQRGAIKPERLDAQSEKLLDELPARELRESEMRAAQNKVRELAELVRGAA